MNSIVWKDITKYRRNEEKNNPKTVCLTVDGNADIVVTTHIHYDGWIARSRELDIELHPLDADNLEDAKIEAVAYVKSVLTERMERLTRVSKELEKLFS